MMSKTITLAAAGLIGVGALAACASGTATPRAVPSSSTLDDWWAAVCKPGSSHNGNGHLPNADLGQANCLSTNTGMPISSGSYSSNYLARNDATMFSRYGSSAIIATTSGNFVLFVAMGDPYGTVLQPLAQYGFTITSGRG